MNPTTCPIEPGAMADLRARLAERADELTLLDIAFRTIDSPVGPLLLAETYVTEPIRYEEGRVHLPEGPGLGVEPDHDAVERFTRR